MLVNLWVEFNWDVLHRLTNAFCNIPLGHFEWWQYKHQNIKEGGGKENPAGGSTNQSNVSLVIIPVSSGRLQIKASIGSKALT